MKWSQLATPSLYFVLVTCRKVAQNSSMTEGVDYNHVCVGLAFTDMIDSLTGKGPANFPKCDVAVSGVTVTSKRKKDGIEYTAPIYHDKLLAMVHGSVQKGCMHTWGFFQPLHLSVWVAALITMFTIPFIIFFFEFVASVRCVLRPSNPGKPYPKVLRIMKRYCECQQCLTLTLVINASKQ
jgi:hypothetical protein